MTRPLVSGDLAALDGPEVRPGDIVAYSTVRNERERLPFLLEHHRRLGVDRFLIVDNASDDGTAEFLLRQEDVLVFHTSASYAGARQGVDWQNLILDAFADDHWALVVDADELFVYPECETVGLRRLAAWVESHQADAIEAFILDLYCKGPIRACRLEETDWFRTIAWFDPDTYRWPVDDALYRRVPTEGGPRERLFWADEVDVPPPFLGKIPFLRWRVGRAFEASTHIIGGTVTAPVTGALLHFKLAGDLLQKAPVEAERQEHWADGSEYGVYARVLRENPDLEAHTPSSVRFERSMQLVDLGLLTVPDDYPASLPSESSAPEQR
jgi:hypothetical protein